MICNMYSSSNCAHVTKTFTIQPIPYFVGQGHTNHDAIIRLTTPLARVIKVMFAKCITQHRQAYQQNNYLRDRKSLNPLGLIKRISPGTEVLAWPATNKELDILRHRGKSRYASSRMVKYRQVSCSFVDKYMKHITDICIISYDKSLKICYITQCQ